MESRTRNRKVASSSLGPAGIVGGGSECPAFSLLSIPRLRCPWARHRTPSCSGCVFTVCLCVHCCVCVCNLDGLNADRTHILSMGHHTWWYVTSLVLICFKLSHFLTQSVLKKQFYNSAFGKLWLCQKTDIQAPITLRSTCSVQLYLLCTQKRDVSLHKINKTNSSLTHFQQCGTLQLNYLQTHSQW